MEWRFVNGMEWYKTTTYIFYTKKNENPEFIVKRYYVTDLYIASVYIRLLFLIVMLNKYDGLTDETSFAWIV